MADRLTFNGASTEVPWQNTGTVPEGFGDQYARHITTLYDASALPLTSVGGTGDNVTATVDPSLPPGGLRDGMKFGITWAATNSGPMTLKVGAAPAVPVLSADGAVAVPGLAILGGRALLEYVGGAFRVLSGGAGSGGAARYYWQFTASGTWAKPAGLPDDTMVTVEAWGGGGSGSLTGGASASYGGGGGAYARGLFRLGDLPATVPVAIGAGGAAPTVAAAGFPGGDTSFGSLLVAYGGAGGRSTTGGGSLGGGELASGVNGGLVGGGAPTGGGHASTIYGGGGGGGGCAVYGGAGGANGPTNPVNGVSVYGGNGGTASTAGSAPGGGGGSGNSGQPSGAGARGEVRIWI